MKRKRHALNITPGADWYSLTVTADREAELHIYGVIVDTAWWGDETAASDLVPELDALDVDRITLRINSPGGSVYAGIAIMNALARHPAHVTATVDGLAASAATLVMLAADDVVMGAGSELMIHDVWAIIAGTADDLRKEAVSLDRLSSTAAELYAERAGTGTADEWRAAMLAETWYSAREAVDAGLADRVAELTTSDAPAASVEHARAAQAFGWKHPGRATAPAPMIPAGERRSPARAADLAGMARAALAPLLDHPERKTAMPCATCGQVHAAGVACNAPAPAAAATPPAAPEPRASDAAPAPVRQAAPVTPPASSSPRRVTLAQAAELVSSVVRQGGSAADVRLALNDVTPASLPGTGAAGMEDPFLRDTWLGELWTASKVERPWIDLAGTPKNITGLKVHGWRWEVKPAVGDYAGDKAAIPTNSPKIVPAEEGVERTAGGWDVDRIYVDLGDASLIEALWQAAVEDYRTQSEAKVATALYAAATGAGNSLTFAAALVSLGQAASTLGARVSQVGIATDLWADFANLTRDEVPWWLGSGDNIAIGTTTGNVGGVKFFSDTSLPAGAYMAADSRAYTYYEKNPPVRVNAVDLANGGVDLGLFGYHGLIVNDARALISGTVGPAV